MAEGKEKKENKIKGVETKPESIPLDQEKTLNLLIFCNRL